MLKKIALLLMLILPMGVFAQTIKFGHMNSNEVIQAMPQYTKAVEELNALQKKYSEEFQRYQEEFNKKYMELQQAAAKDSLPPNILERRQKELEDGAQRQQQFQEEASQTLEKTRDSLMMPIYQKLEAATKAVGDAEGVLYIFDMARTPLAYIGAQSIDLTPKVKTQLGIK